MLDVTKKYPTKIIATTAKSAMYIFLKFFMELRIISYSFLFIIFNNNNMLFDAKKIQHFHYNALIRNSNIYQILKLCF